MKTSKTWLEIMQGSKVIQCHVYSSMVSCSGNVSKSLKSTRILGQPCLQICWLLTGDLRISWKVGYVYTWRSAVDQLVQLHYSINLPLLLKCFFGSIIRNAAILYFLSNSFCNAIRNFCKCMSITRNRVGSTGKYIVPSPTILPLYPK